jgi:hypothetical protein
LSCAAILVIHICARQTPVSSQTCDPHSVACIQRALSIRVYVAPDRAGGGRLRFHRGTSSSSSSAWRRSVICCVKLAPSERSRDESSPRLIHSIQWQDRIHDETNRHDLVVALRCRHHLTTSRLGRFLRRHSQRFHSGRKETPLKAAARRSSCMSVMSCHTSYRMQKHRTSLTFLRYRVKVPE